jgi:P2-related tail formation protein
VYLTAKGGTDEVSLNLRQLWQPRMEGAPLPSLAVDFLTPWRWDDSRAVVSAGRGRDLSLWAKVARYC